MMIAKPKPLKSEREKKKQISKPQRKILEKQLEAIVKQVIFWRDGQECVQRSTDGWRCGGNGLAWGHYIAQGQSHWLKYDLGNVFVQCGNHNLLDHNGDKSYAAWFMSTFGISAVRAMEAERDFHRKGKGRTIDELETLIRHYESLYQNRFYVKNDDISDLIRLGYYGSIIAKAK